MQTSLLHTYVAAHNQGVRHGGFSGVASLFTLDARLIFEGLPIPPFEGRTQIAQAFADQPPNDELLLIETWTTNGVQHGRYKWKREPTDPGGVLRIVPRDGLIRKLTISVLLKLKAC